MAINTTLRRTISIEFAGQTGEITYKLGALNEAFWTYRAEHFNDPEWIYWVMERLIERWDLVDDDGITLPITVDTMRPIAKNLFYAIYEAIWEDVKNVSGGS